MKKNFHFALVVWILGVGQFAYYYGNLPISRGSDSPTSIQTEPVEVKCKIKYITKDEKILFDLSRNLFFGTIALFALLGMLRIYGPVSWREKLDKLNR